MPADIDSMFSAIHTRRRWVWALHESGNSTRAIARITGEHRKQVRRWLKVSPPKSSGNGLNSGIEDDAETLNVPTHKTFSKNSVYFNGDGRPDAGTFHHPVDDIEPLESVPTKNDAIRTAALRYLLRQEERPMEVVAQEIGCTRAAISRVLVLLSDKLGFAALNQKSKSARLSYSQARIQSVARRG